VIGRVNMERFKELGSKLDRAVAGLVVRPCERAQGAAGRRGAGAADAGAGAVRRWRARTRAAPAAVAPRPAARGRLRPRCPARRAAQSKTDALLPPGLQKGGPPPPPRAPPGGGEADPVLEQLLRGCRSKHVRRQFFLNPPDEYTEAKDVKVLAGTYNVAGRRPPPGQRLGEWLHLWRDSWPKVGRARVSGPGTPWREQLRGPVCAGAVGCTTSAVLRRPALSR
jgi:hypothetical protein